MYNIKESATIQLKEDPTARKGFVRRNLEKAINGNANTKEDGYKKLLELVQKTESLWPLLEIGYEAQEILIRSQNDGTPKGSGIRGRTSSFLARFLREFPTPEGTFKEIRADEEAKNYCHQIIDRQKKLDQSINHPFLPLNYKETIIKASTAIIDSHTNTIIQVGFVGTRKSSSEVRPTEAEMEEFMKWYREHNAQITQAPDPDDTWIELNNKTLQSIKRQPAVIGFPDSLLYERELSGISLAWIEAQDPENLDEETYKKISAYLVELSHKTQNIKHPEIIELFILPTNFFHPRTLRKLDAKNLPFFAVVNKWQERLSSNLISDDITEDQAQEVKAIFEALPSSDSSTFMSVLRERLTRPWIYNPQGELVQGLTYDFDYFNRHLSCKKAWEESGLTIDSVSYIMMDKLTYNYVKKHLPGMLRDLARRLNSDALTKLANETDALPSYEEIVVRDIDEYFKRSAGESFLDELNQKKEEIKRVTELAWRDTFQSGTEHYLPTHDPSRIIFDDNSLPKIIGIDEVAVRAVDLPQWKLETVFILQGMSIIGYLNQGGDFENELVKEKFPGLHLMLEHIATLSAHDMIIQNKLSTRTQPTAQTRHDSNISGEIKPENENTNETQAHKTTLPRTASVQSTRTIPAAQSDEALIESVSKLTKRKARRVDLHKRGLQHSQEYREAIEQYQLASMKGLELESAAATLAEARQRMHRVSPEKITRVPSRFMLESAIDPLTGEQYYLQTWVIGHQSPKPTPEDLASPVRMYDKYYRGGSALASLDQMKTWLIGKAGE